MDFNDGPMTGRQVLVLKIWAGCCLAAAIAVLWLTGCGIAKGGGGYHAEPILGPYGVRCYVVLDDQGKAVGGNCTP